MTDVVGPMAEAADYERLQLARRRGLVCFQLALFCLALATWGIDIARPGNSTWGFLATIAAFLVAGAARLALKRNPKWNEVFRQYERPTSPSMKALIIVLGLATLFVIPIQLLSDQILAVAMVAAAALIGFGTGYQARDWGMFHAGWGPLLVGLALALTPDGLEASWSSIFAPLGLVIPLLALSSFRLLAPRRWLVR
ncbi:MAG: hypothetical protein ACYC2H_03540 [Thermoplasmatota archaeon]